MEASERDVQFYIVGLLSAEFFLSISKPMQGESDPMLFTRPLLNNGQSMKVKMAWSLVRQHGGSSYDTVL